jgi:hypothetical protein
LTPLWRALYEAGAELVLSGHDHTYERFGPQDPYGSADPERGIRQFVVGTGGKGHYGFRITQPNSEARDSEAFGVVLLALGNTEYRWQFLSETTSTFSDRGSANCHTTPATYAES